MTNCYNSIYIKHFKFGIKHRYKYIRTYIHLFIVNPTILNNCSSKNHQSKRQVHATLARHIARFDAIATRFDGATPWQSLNRLSVGYMTESDTSATSAHRKPCRRACVAHAQVSAGGVYTPLTPGRMPERLPSLGNVHTSLRADTCCWTRLSIGSPLDWGPRPRSSV